MRQLAAAIALGAVAFSTGCATLRENRPAAGSYRPVILVSFDGYRWDYTERVPTPHFDAMAARGVRAGRLIPAFPTKTFPNHYTIVTGLYPGTHGLVANNIWDPDREVRFGLSRRDQVADGRWYGGEPVWVTAEKAGLVTSPHFWPGSEAEIGGMRPTYAGAYDGSIPDEERIDMLLRRLAQAEETRPVFATLYFSFVDDAGHRYDPDGSPEVSAAIARADELLGRLVAGLESLGLGDHAELVVVSDHGMSSNARDRAIFLDELIDLESVRVVDWSPVASIWPREEAHTEEIYDSLRADPHLSVYRRGEAPERWRYRESPRIPPILAVADDGWVITTRRRFPGQPREYPAGSHGYDNALTSMGALFLATGPSFGSGVVVDEIENIHLYELLCHLLEIEPAPNQGSLAALSGLLAH